MTFGERLREVRKAKRITRQELGELIDKSSETIARYERNERNASIEQVKKIAEVLHVSIASLMGEEKTNYTSESAIYTSDLIKLTMYAISTVVSCEMEFTPLQRSEGVGYIFTKKDSFAVYDENKPPFTVVMPNDSMRGAGIDEGDLVVVNPAEPVENGKPAFAIYNGAGIIRWILQKADGSVELRTANTDFAPITVELQYVNDTSKYRVVGRVVEVLSSKTPKDAF